jgi:hypothetical protein
MFKRKAATGAVARWSAALILTVTLIATLGGCNSFEVTAVSPQPNIALPAKRPAFELTITPAVADMYEIPQQSAMAGGKVSGWRSSLKTGFHNAFPAKGGEGDKLTLVLEHVVFSVAPAAVNGMGGVVSARGQIEYRGRWTIGDKDLLPISGTVESKKTTTTPGEANLLAQSAIESMYEEIWSQLVKAAAAAPPAAAQ